MMKLFCGVGINDMVGVSQTREYRTWSGMISRCHSENSKKRFLAYTECSVSDKFLKLSSFYNWCQNQIGFNSKFDLDKDLLHKGNKEYHPDKCVFIPREINLFIRVKKQIRGEFLIGVKRDKWGNYIAQISIHGENIYLGLFRLEMDAFQAYKQAKEAHIKVLAEKYKDQIDPRAYNALMNYKVEITD